MALFGTELMTTGVNNMMAARREQDARQQNFELNERAAANADKRTRALYADFQSPSALLQQYKDAGLSPSLMFANGGASGATPAAGAEGEGASGISPNVFGAQAANAALIAKTIAETENIKADTKVKEKEEEVTQEKINNLIQDTKNKFLEGEHKVIENMLAQIELSIKGEYGERQVIKELDILTYKADQMVEELRKLKVDAKISEETQETIIQYYFDRTTLQAKEILLKIAQKNLTTEQIDDLISQQITRKNLYSLKSEEVYQNLLLKLQELGVEKGHLNNENTKILLEELRGIIDVSEKFAKGSESGLKKL